MKTMTAKDLKNALLQEAVQGRLVPQCAADGNARALLDAIRAEKQKSAKSKSSKPLPPIADDEIPFDIPDSWVWVRLGEVCDIKGGKRLPVGCSFSEKKTNHIYIRVSDMKNNTISLDDLHYITDEVYEKIKNYIITTNDIYMTIVGATIGKCGIIPEPLNNMNLTENAARIIPFLIDKYYLLMCLNTDFCQSQFIEKTKQVGVQKMALARFSNSIIPLPPLAEQHRIVSAIEKLLPLIDEYGKKKLVINALNSTIGQTAKKAILQEAVQGRLVPQCAADGNARELLDAIRAEKQKSSKSKSSKPLPPIADDEIPFDIPDNWVWVRLGEIGIFNGGYAFKSENYVSKEKGVRVLRISDFDENGIKDKNPVYYPHNNELENYKLSENDIIMCMTGGTVGKSFLIKSLNEEMYVNQRVADVKCSSSVNVDYVYSVILSHHIQKNIQENKNSTNDNISADLIKNFLIPLPPLAEQRRIVSAIEKLLPMCERLGWE